MIDWNSYCGDSIWDNQLTWHTSYPRFTVCFQNTVLVWTPICFLLLSLPVLIGSLIKSNRSFGWNRYNLIRQCFTLALLLVTLVDLITLLTTTTSADNNTRYTVDLVNAILQLLVAILLFVLLYSFVKRGIHTSGAIWTYFGLASFCLVLRSVSIFLKPPPSPSSSQQQQQQQLLAKNNQTQTPGVICLVINCILNILLFAQSFFSDFPKSVEKIEDVEEFGVGGVPKSVEAQNEQQHQEQEQQQQQTTTSKKKICPKTSASFFSQLTYSWYSTLTYIGWRRTILMDDVWRTRESDSSMNNYGLFEKNLCRLKQKHYNKHNHNKKEEDNDQQAFSSPFKVNILRLIASSWGYYFFTGAAFKLINDICIFINPQLMSLLMATEVPGEAWHGYIYAVALFVVSTTQIVSLNYYFNRMQIFGMRVRTQLTAAIYRKALHLSNASRAKFTTGEIVNLMAVDAQRFIEISTFVNLIWSAPLQIVIALVMLWRQLGVAVLGGLVYILLTIPLNSYVTKKVKNLQVKQMKLKDTRVKVMNEVLNGMKIIKLYGWERAFIAKVHNIRREELRVLRRINYYVCIFQALWNLAPFLMSFITFIIYVLIDSENMLTAEKAFVSLTLFNVLRFPLTMLPNLVTSLVMVSVSVKRLNNFLSSSELRNYVQRVQTKKYCIQLDGCTFDWKTSMGDGDGNVKKSKNVENGTNNGAATTSVTSNPPTKPLLNNISMQIEIGSFVAIVGNVGSGKSSLINAILGNMEMISGRINVAQSMRIAYTPQEAWIQNCTLRDNILFGQPFNEQYYRQVVHACSLLPDFAILPGGDLTEIGEKGINLSGGQKQRVSLARACYNDADVYLLDDPLAAVDSHVGKYIFENILHSETGLLRNKTRILVTNNLTVLPYTDSIFVLKDGELIEWGSYHELMAKRKYFSNLIQQYAAENEQQDETNDDYKGEEKIDIKNIKIDAQSPQQQNANVTNFDFKMNKLVEKEEAQTGRVKWSVYWRYLKAISFFWFTLVILNYALAQAANVGSSEILALMTRFDNDDERWQMYKYLIIYGVIGSCQGVFNATGWYALTKGILGAAIKLHNRMLHTIMRSNMAFFDATPLGRILNRFSKDIDVCDNTISNNVRTLLTCMFGTLATIIIISKELPMFLVVVVPVCVLFYFVQKLYVPTSRQLKRLESITKSPIYSHFSETLSGVSTIRAYGMSASFIEKSDQFVDTNNSYYFASLISNRWLSIRLEMVANLILLFAALFSVIYQGTLFPGGIGLVLSYALSTTQNLNYLVRATSDIETNIVGVERILEYTDLSTEAEWDIEQTRPPPNWPSNGVVHFDQYSTRYRPGLELVLKAIDAYIKPGEKIGIVGRTGAGKSSLTLALFRLIEPASGRIIIDELDVSTLGLHQLRQRLTIIPQDPVLFSGTIRTNLDPFNERTDDELWRCLELAHLSKFVRSHSEGLQYEIQESGNNLSVGQRQLVCLARALLRKTKILILDEATAAVDMETDDLIQRTIREAFSDCTILTIAHRLHTIIDSTRVLVLNAGEIAEFDTPQFLLQNPKSVFYSMAEAAGLLVTQSS